MKTLYLHIGTPKTGTTSIQNFCAENAALLEEQGYCYPASPFKFRRIGINRNAHFLVQKVYDEKNERAFGEEEKLFRKGMKMVLDAFRKFDRVILSDEGIWNVIFGEEGDRFWKKLKKGAEVNHFAIKVVVYLRRQDRLAESWWNQKIKAGGGMYATTKWEDFIQDFSMLEMNYYGPLEMIEKEIGQENIIVRRFDRKYFKNGSIYEDFLDAIGAKYKAGLVVTEERRNTALLGNAPEMKRILNTISGLSHKDNVFFRRVLKKLSEEQPELKKKTLFSSEEAEQFMEQYREDNRKLMKKYFGKEEDLFDMDFSRYDKWVSGREETKKDMVRFIGQTAIDLREENRLLKGQVKVLQQQHEEQIKRTKMLETRLSEQSKEMKGLKRRLDKPLRNMVSSIRNGKF